MKTKTALLWASFFMLSAVIFGAFGAHGLKKLISFEHIAICKTGVFCQFIHSWDHIHQTFYIKIRVLHGEFLLMK